MKQDEIIEMAKQCGIVVGYPKYQDIEAFAKLIAEKAFNEGYSIGEAAGFKEGVKLERKARGQA